MSKVTFEQNYAFPKSGRLSFRQVTPGDEKIIFPCIDDELTKDWIGWEKSETLLEEGNRVDMMVEEIEKGEAIHFLSFENATGDFVGMCGLEHDMICPDDMEINVWTKHSRQGRGYGTEMVQALLGWVKENTDLAYVIYSVTGGNKGSEAMISRLGLTPFRTFPAMKRGCKREVHDYKIFL